MGFRGKQFKSPGKSANGWTDWHHIWYTSADSSGNGHTAKLKTFCPSIHQGAIGGGGGGLRSKKSGSCQTVELIGNKLGTRLQIHLGIDISQYIML